MQPTVFIGMLKVLEACRLADNNAFGQLGCDFAFVLYLVLGGRQDLILQGTEVEVVLLGHRLHVLITHRLLKVLVGRKLDLLALATSQRRHVQYRLQDVRTE